MVSLYTDGACKGNPGPAGVGIHIPELNIKKNKYLGKRLTNNKAEYYSLLFGLQVLIELGEKDVNVFMDSKLVINQMKGIYQVRDSKLKVIYDKIIGLLYYFDSFTFKHIPREENKIADSEANKSFSF